MTDKHALIAIIVDGTKYGLAVEDAPEDEAETRATAFKIGALFHDTYLKHMGYEVRA